MSEARIEIISREESSGGLPINYSCYGVTPENGTVLFRWGTSEKTVEIRCTNEWARRFVKRVIEALDEQSETELQIPAPSAPFPAGQVASADT